MYELGPRMDTEESVRRDWALISYSHADRVWADWLHKSLEIYPMPKDLVGKSTPVGAPAPKRFVPIFRDREELPMATDLGAVIEKALCWKVEPPNLASAEVCWGRCWRWIRRTRWRWR